MEQESKNTEKNIESGKAKQLKNLKPAWKKGDPTPNPKGRGKGVLNYATLRERAIRKLAEKNNKTPDEIEDEINANALLEARKGNYSFYKDDKDRLYGTATHKVEFKGEIENTLNAEQLSKIAGRILNGNTKK